jgi:hypothetical protein
MAISSYFSRTTPTAVRDRSTTDLAKIKDHLRINLTDTSHDVQLTELLEAAKEQADMYCQNIFTTGIPKTVETWIRMQVSSLFEWSSNGVQQISEPGFGSSSLKDRFDTTMLRPHRTYPGF